MVWKNVSGNDYLEWEGNFKTNRVEFESGTIQHVPSAIKDITNKEYVDAAGGGVSNHASLAYLNWASAAHTFDASLAMNSYPVTDMPEPLVASAATTKHYVDQQTAVASGSISAAGNDTEIQFNDSGAFGASSALTYNGTVLTLTNNATPGTYQEFGGKQYKVGTPTVQNFAILPSSNRVAFFNDGTGDWASFDFRPADDNDTVLRITPTSVDLDNDTYPLTLGDGADCSIYYDGTNMNINPKLVGSGYLKLLGTLSVSETASAASVVANNVVVNAVASAAHVYTTNAIASGTASGARIIVTGDNTAASTAYVPNIVYGVASTSLTASDYPIGSLLVVHEA